MDVLAINVLSLLKAIGGQGVFLGQFSVLTYMIEGSESELPLFTELKKLDPLSRYGARKVAKVAIFHTFVKFPRRFPENGPKLK